ncbi:MAG TPA: GIY-YIG nuclease family protein [Tepidisphaeraceae bacterium]|jgi:hypothetical protein|nr:GIY-YIG nuclease family protein [Tepidisphaeraceae bacterium]
MADRVTDEDLELLGELGVDTAPEDKGGRTPREQRIIAGFEEIERFYEENGRAPQHGEGRDIFERLYAVRLDRIRESEECRTVLSGLDRHKLLSGPAQVDVPVVSDEATDDELLAALGVEADAPTDNDVAKLVHVRSTAERAAAEDVARRAPCDDFEAFRPIFEQVQDELSTGRRQTAKLERGDRDAKRFGPGDLFIIGGQKALIASAGEPIDKPQFPGDRRLRVIFDNGTEANLWLRSLKRALYEEGNRMILPVEDVAPPLFADYVDEGDAAAGSIYVLRSKSDHPFVAAHRELIHKIGVTGGDVKGRLGNAKKDPTYLLADVDVVAEYKLANINRKAMEGLLHKVFAAVRLDVELKDRFGSQVEPREWFLVPISAIDEAIKRVKDQSISRYRYDPVTARLTLI